MYIAIYAGLTVAPVAMRSGEEVKTMPHIRKYKKARGAARHQFEAVECVVIETVKNGYRRVCGEHPNFKYSFSDLYKVKIKGKSGKPVGKIIETPFVHFQ